MPGTPWQREISLVTNLMSAGTQAVLCCQGVGCAAARMDESVSGGLPHVLSAGAELSSDDESGGLSDVGSP